MKPVHLLAIAALAAVAALAIACGGGGDDGVSDLDTLEAGDCLIYRATGDVREVYCADPHHAEVLGVVLMEDGPYPGDDAINSFAIANCPDGVDTFIYPTERSWGAGDRQISCLEEDVGTPASPSNPAATTTPAPESG